MDSEDLLYNNKFISTNVGGINDDRGNLLDYLDEIDSERNKLEITEKKQKSKSTELSKQNQEVSTKVDFDDPIKYRKTVVNVDSRYRQISNESIKSNIVNELEWKSITNVTKIKKYILVDGDGNQVDPQPEPTLIELHAPNFDNVAVGMYIFIYLDDHVDIKLKNNPYKIESIEETETNFILKFNANGIDGEGENDELSNELDNNSLNVKYNPSIWKFTENSNEIEIASKDHGLKFGDNISIDVNSNTNLNKCGGLIKNIVSATEIVVDSNVTHLLSTNNKINLYIEGETNQPEERTISAIIFNHDTTYDTTITLNQGITVTNHINNYWEIPNSELDSTKHHQVYTVENENRIYVYHPNHGFKNPYNLSSFVYKIDHDGATPPTLTIKSQFKENSLKNGMEVFILVDSDTITLQNNPYVISDVAEYEINELDNLYLTTTLKYLEFKVTLKDDDSYPSKNSPYNSIKIQLDNNLNQNIEETQVSMSNFEINRIPIKSYEYLKFNNIKSVVKTPDSIIEMQLNIEGYNNFFITDYIGQQIYINFNNTTYDDFSKLHTILPTQVNNIIRFQPDNIDDWDGIDLDEGSNILDDAYWVPPESVWLRLQIDNYNLTEYINYKDQIKVQLNLNELDDERTYLAFNVRYDTNKSYIEINTQLLELNIRNTQSSNMYLELVNIGNISPDEINGEHNIHIVNKNFYYINTFKKATKSLYSGSINLNCKKLSTNNISHIYINSDYPVDELRRNGFYKIIYIDENHFKIKTTSPTFPINLLTQYQQSKVNYVDYSDDSDNFKLTYTKIKEISAGYSNPNCYNYELGRTFQQIVKIRLVSSEFPNSAFVIKNSPANLKNNKIYWIIKDDGDHVYEATISSGSYLNTTDFKLEIIDVVSNVNRIYDTSIKTEMSIVLDFPRNIVEFRIYSVTILSNAFSTKEGSKLLKINYTNHNLEVGDTIIISNATATGGISMGVINYSLGYQVKLVSDDYILIELPVVASKSQDGRGGSNIQLRKLVPFKILWNRPDSFGHILGFNNAGKSSFKIPPFMEVVSNDIYNSYNDSENDLLFDFVGEKYIYMTNDILSTIDNNSKIKNAFAKIQLNRNPGGITYNSFVSTAKIFSEPLSKLSSLLFKFYDFNGYLFNFNQLNHSFSLEITEKLEESQNKGISSRTGKYINN